MLKFNYSGILKIALPLMFGTFVQSIVAFTDAAFVSQLGTVAFDAVGNASLIYMAVYMLLRGLGDGTQIRIANENGKGNKVRIGQIFSNALGIQLLFSLFLLMLLIFLIPYFLQFFTSNPGIEKGIDDYLEFRSFGLLFSGLELIIVGFLVGIGKTRIIIVSTCILAFSNIILDYGLIFGNFGLPELGVKGAALASSIAEFISFIFLIFYVFMQGSHKAFHLNFRFNWNPHLSRLLTRLSIPLMFQGFISISTWLIFFTFIEQMGAHELEASQSIRHLYFLAFIPIMGYAMATRTFVSFFVGQKRENEIPKVIAKIAFMSVLSLVLFFHGAIFYPEFLISLVNSNPGVNALASDILRLVAGSMVLFSITTVLFNSISGLGKTRISFFIEFITIFVYIIACIFIFKVWHWEVKWTWLVEYLYFALNGILSVIYLKYYFKKSKQ